MRQCTKITISNKKYPIRFDYLVLKEVAERYESVQKFELDLLGFEKVGKDENGEVLIRKVKDPSISCILFVLPKMINSALDYQGYDIIEEKKIIQDIDINFVLLADIIHKEMQNCFKSDLVEKKKYNPTPKVKK